VSELILKDNYKNDKKYHWLVEKEFSHNGYTMPAGFRTDLMSVPDALKSLVNHKSAKKWSVIHDNHYFNILKGNKYKFRWGKFVELVKANNNKTYTKIDR
jgi:hypothetical protein